MFAFVLVIALMPLTVAADRQGVIDVPLNEPAGRLGNPNLRGIASHAWWLDLEVYGDQLFHHLDELQITTVRISIDWRRFEPEQGVWDWSLYDEVLGELAKRHIIIIADFNTIPAWASHDVAGCSDDVTEVQRCELREDMYPAFANAMEAALTRYAWIEYWEFWNEPELWTYLGMDGPTYLRHLRMFYDIAHRVNPEVTVAAQTLVGVEYMEFIYNISELYYGAGNEPWDAISIHPYNWHFVPREGEPSLEINYARILGLRDLMIRRGDGDQKIWITEYGWINTPEWQARNLPIALDWMQTQPYIEFAHLHMLHDWSDVDQGIFGLLEIVPDTNGSDDQLTPETEFRPKEPFYSTFKNYPTDFYGRYPTEPDTTIFLDTGHAISGRFLDAWRERGGTQTFGAPLTRRYPLLQADGSWLLVQDFERGRLEWHPENAGSPSEMLGASLGGDIAQQRASEQPFLPIIDCVESANRRCFAETGHSLSAGFLGYWQSNDGLTRFGLPVSEEFSENGRVVQYFERARLEWWPELGAGYDIVVGALGRELLMSIGWLSAGGPLEDVRLPTRRQFP